MPSVNIVKTLDQPISFNTKWVVDTYDLDINKYKKEWKFNFELPETWNIGLIVGNSGSGKSLVANEIFKNVHLGEVIQDKNKPLVDCFEGEMSKISNALTSVGLGSIPEWITNYGHLSTGQKMRADIAKCLLSDEEIVVFDEFTSVVDRQVAKVLSHSISKAFRKQDRKFVAVTCHHDVIDWLCPDWVLDMDAKKFYLNSKKKDQISKSKSKNVTEKNGIFSKIITI